MREFGRVRGKRAPQLKMIATRLWLDFGNSSAKKLRTMSAEDAYEYLRGLPGSDRNPPYA